MQINKIFLLLFCVILLTGSVMAEELLTIDNIKQYDEESKTITIVNTFGLGRDISTIQLNTPLNFHVGAGYQKVAEFTINSFDDTYKDVFDKMEFYNLNNNEEEINRQFDYKYKTIKDMGFFEVNGTYVKHEKEVWKDLDTIILLKGNITIGVFTNVQIGDYVEWIPTLFGKRINEWATFIQSETTGVSLTSHSSATGKAGQIIEVNQTINISAIGLPTGSESTDVYIQSTYAGGILGEATVVGLVANFTPQVEISVGNHYYILSGHSGAREIYYGATSSFPFDTGYLNWFIGVTEAGANATNYVREIDVIWLDTGISPDTNAIVTLNSPIDAYNSTSSTIDFNCTASDDLNLVNVSFILNAGYNETNSSPVNGSYNIFTRTLADGDYNWTCEGCDNKSLCTNATARTFTIDTLAPTIDINLPANNTNYNYLLSENNITVNTTINDTSLHTCWYNYNSTNTTFSCSTGVTSTNNISLTNETTVIIYANDSVGRISSSTLLWTFDLYDLNNYTSTSSIIESSSSKFIGWFQTKDILTSSYLEYNNTNYSTSIISQGGNIYLLSYSPIAPTVSLDTNISWNFWLNNINATTYNQTVLNLLGDDCTTYTHHFLNFTLFDEENPTTKLVNTTMKYAFDIHTLGGVTILEVNGTSNTNPFGICLNSTINDTKLAVTGTVRFYANTSTTNYIIKHYNFLNYTITNTTIPVNTSLYSINSSKSLPFLLTFRDSTLALSPNILVHIDKQYLETNDFKTVEIPITDTNGQAILNLVRNTAVYNFIMLNSSGMVVATFNNVVAFCQDYTIGSCSIDLSASGVGESTYNYDEDVGISYLLSYSNNSKLVSLTFNSINTSSQKVRIIVLSENQFENQTICSDALTATSGTVSCDVSSALDTNQFLFVEVYSGGELISTEIVNANLSLPGKGGVFGINGFFIAFLFMLFLILLFSNDKQVLVIAVGIGWLTVISLGLISGALIGSASGGIWLIITILIFLWKLKEEEKL